MGTHWADIGTAASFRESRAVSVEVGELMLVVTRCGNGYYAIEDRCTHDGEPLSGGDIEECEIICPRHFARFCMKTGAALSPPAYEPARAFAVRENNGRLLVEVPD
jgi:3-phenylpropionate/trans-cinnamate dioxygenase ferredoxin component